MSLKVSSFNGVKVYNLSSGSKTIPELLSRNKKRALSKDGEYSRRIDLIQDFEMPAASQTIAMTKDCEHIILTGTYAPSVKCYSVNEMSLKFQRGVTSEIVATQMYTI
jgi:ribosome biogenesis protein ENP2